MKLFLSTILLVIISNSVIIAQKWQNVSPAGYNYFSAASFINDKEGWVFARYGEWPNDHCDLVHTTNGAISFTPIFSFPDTSKCFFLQMVDPLNGFARIDLDWPSNEKYLWATYDGGNTWVDISDTSLMNPGNQLYGRYSYYFLDKNTGFVGAANSIYKTSDGGLSWVKTVTPTFIDSASSNMYHPNKLFFYNEKYGWAVNSLSYGNGFVLKTIDGGQSWAVCKPITGELYNIHFADSLHGGATGGNWSDGLVMFTENNFDTISHFYKNVWQQIPDGLFHQNDTTIWMSGWPAVIYKSTDGGTSFIEYDTSFATDNQTDWIHEFQFFDSTGYAFANSFLLRLVDTLHTALIKQTSVFNNIKIVPNPVENSCWIFFNSGYAANSTIEVYSINGKLIIKREQFINTGKNEFLLDISKLEPGIYLLSIKNNSNMYFSRLIKQP
jgi:hypothetical protein